MIGRTRGSAAAGALLLALVGVGPRASAHPMGNISISHYAGIEIRPAEVEVKFLLDFAEIPASAELERVDPDRDERVTPQEREDYLAAKTDEVLPLLRLEVNGRPLALESVWHHVSFPPGEGGLSTVRAAWRLRADLPGGLPERSFLLWNDAAYESFDGWKEIRFSAADGVGIGKTSLREQPTSGELREYPEEWLWRPPRDTKAWCQFGPAAVMARSRTTAAPAAAPPPAPGAEGTVRGRGWAVAVGAAAAIVAAAVAFLRRRARRRA